MTPRGSVTREGRCRPPSTTEALLRKLNVFPSRGGLERHSLSNLDTHHHIYLGMVTSHVSQPGMGQTKNNMEVCRHGSSCMHAFLSVHCSMPVTPVPAVH